MTRIIGTRTALGAIVIAFNFSVSGHAQNDSINDLKVKIFEAKTVQQTFGGGLKHCNEIDGKNFYLQPRDRVIRLDDFHRSLDSLVLGQVFNAETKRPWIRRTPMRAGIKYKSRRSTTRPNAIWSRTLPLLEKKLDDLQRQAPPK